VITKLDGGYQGDDRAIPARRLPAAARAGLCRHAADPLAAAGARLYVDTWRTFIKLLQSGKTQAIGTSNFKARTLTG